MSLLNDFLSFLNGMFSRFMKFFTVNDSNEESHQSTPEEVISEDEIDEIVTAHENRISVAKRTLLNKLYVLEQEIVVFENTFPNEFKAFMDRIETLRQTYNSNLEEISRILTFEVDPELDSYHTGEVLKLERDIEKFLEKEVKFDFISKRLQRLISKLNILYNVTIFHCKEGDKQKAIFQLGRAKKRLVQLACEFKACDYILEDKQLKERIISLISYADYQIFKAYIRNSNEMPDKLIENLVMIVEFDEFDYISAFKAFIKDEISDLGELLTLISDNNCGMLLQKNFTNLLTQLTYSDNAETQLLDTVFWNNFLSFESILLEMLKVNEVDKEIAKVRLIVRMSISVDETEVLVSSKSKADLELTKLYLKTHADKLILLIKLLRNIYGDVTYREIYFLLQLFEVIEEVENTPNELIGHIKKYLKKYPYSRKNIMDKKAQVISSSKKEYVACFSLNDYEKELTAVLASLNIDFKVVGDNVLINSFYFQGLTNVLNSLQANTQNIT